MLVRATDTLHQLVNPFGDTQAVDSGGGADAGAGFFPCSGLWPVPGGGENRIEGFHTMQH